MLHITTGKSTSKFQNPMSSTTIIRHISNSSRQNIYRARLMNTCHMGWVTSLYFLETHYTERCDAYFCSFLSSKDDASKVLGWIVRLSHIQTHTHTHTHTQDRNVFSWTKFSVHLISHCIHTTVYNVHRTGIVSLFLDIQCLRVVHLVSSNCAIVCKEHWTFVNMLLCCTDALCFANFSFTLSPRVQQHIWNWSFHEWTGADT